MTDGIKKIALGALALALLVGGLSGCTKQPKEGVVIVGEWVYDETFPENGWTSREFALESAGSDWKVYSASGWISAVVENGKVTITPQGNVETRARNGEVILRSGPDKATLQSRFRISQEKGSTYGLTKLSGSGVNDPLFNGSLPASGVSHNGRYVFGGKANISFIYDRKENKTILLGDGTSTAFDPAVGTAGSVMIYDVSDNGIAVGCVGNLPMSYNIHTKELTMLPLDADVEDMGGRTASSGNAWSISSDGRSIAGYIGYPTSGSGGADREASYLPVVWKSGEIIVLGHQKEGLGEGDYNFGYSATGISADGSRVVGYMTNPSAQWIAVYWEMSDPSKANFFGRGNEDFYHDVKIDDSKTRPSRYPFVEGISGDGKTIIGRVVDIATTESETIFTPFTYDIDTGGYTVVKNVGGATGTALMPDGSLICGRAAAGRISGSFFYQNGAEVSINDYLSSKKVLNVPFDNYTLRDVSAGGKVLTGFLQDSKGAYTAVVISL